MKNLGKLLIVLGFLNLIPGFIELYIWIFTNHAVWHGNTFDLLIVSSALIGGGLVVLWEAS